MKNKKVKMGFDIKMERGPVMKPVAIHFWNSPQKLDKAESQKPFKYMADALMGLSLVKLNTSLQCPVSNSKTDVQFCKDAWNQIDPHHVLYRRIRDRVEAIRLEVPQVDAKVCSEFAQKFDTLLEKALKPDGLDLKNLWPVIDLVSEFENKKGAPLLFNFGLSFHTDFISKLHSLYALLFNLRSVVAIDYNAQVDDPSHEALKVDSITDYFPRADYIVNDALLYWQFIKLSHPFVATRQSDVRVEKLLVEPVKNAFHQFAHNGCYLIDHLPKSFLNSMPNADLEEALYLVQMDWLLGSEAGLLYRIREEIYGLQNGYEKIFWRDLEHSPAKKAVNLSLNFELGPADLKAA